MTAVALFPRLAPPVHVTDELTASVLQTWLAGKNPETIRAYLGDLETFRRFAGAPALDVALTALFDLPPGGANAVGLRYRGALVEAGLAAATINRRLAALRSLVQLARLIGRVSWQLEVPGVEAVPYRDTRGCGPDGFRALMASLDQELSPKAIRDRAIIRLLFDCGLRRGEVVSLDMEHYDAEAGILSILGKKRSGREPVTLPAPTRAALDVYLTVRGAAPGALFRNFDRAGKGQRLTGHSIARLVAARAQVAGIGKVRPHGLRHAAITHALDVTGGDVRRVQRFSRHRDLRTLTLYDDNRQDLAGEVAALVAAAG